MIFGTDMTEASRSHVFLVTLRRNGVAVLKNEMIKDQIHLKSLASPYSIEPPI